MARQQGGQPATKVPEIRRGDTVVVLSGKDAGKRGTINFVTPPSGKIGALGKVATGLPTIRELSRQPFESESLMLDFAAKGSAVTCPPAISQHLVEEVF